MNVGIVTLTKMYNYGNSLQNYAVQQILKHNGLEPETIIYSFVKPKEIIIRIVKKLFNTNKKILAFETFENEYIVKSNIKQLTTINKNAEKRYSYYFVGSDQVWNTSWYSNYPFMEKAYLLDFTTPEKKISFSASFGIDSVKNKYEDVFSKKLKDFKAISVREEAGARIVKELTGREATVLADPTMLLTKDEWRKVSKKPERAKEGYILTYFLSPKCNEVKRKIEEIRSGRDVYELLCDEDKICSTAGPSEFLWLFDHADMILTDSFHACVFSFLFNKPFIVYDRNWDGGNMNSRLETLLSKFSLKRKYVNSGLANDIWEHDYTEGYQQLDLEREKAIKFLTEALMG